MKQSYIANILKGVGLCVFWGYPLFWKAKFYLIILTLVMLIINIYLIVTSFQELGILIEILIESTSE